MNVVIVKLILITILAALFGIPLSMGAVAKAQSGSINKIVLGVIASSHDKAGVTLLKDKNSGEVKAYKEGDKFGVVRIKKVERKQVLFEVRGQLFTLGVGHDIPQQYIDSKPQGTISGIGALNSAMGFEKQGNTFRITKTLKEELIGNNLSKILMQAATVPETKNGRLIGFKLLDIEPDSIYTAAGFEDGDVITHINDLPINDAAVAIRALNNLRDAPNADIGFQRKGQERTIKIQVN